MRFYISCRPLRMGTILLTPKEQLKHGFKGLNFSFDLVASNHLHDGRFLYEVIISEEYPLEQKQEIKTVILEGLQVFGVHEKSLQSAKELAETLTEKDYRINNDKIERDV